MNQTLNKKKGIRHLAKKKKELDIKQKKKGNKTFTIGKKQELDIKQKNKNYTFEKKRELDIQQN